MTQKLLEISGLKTFFRLDNYTIKAVNDVSFSVHKGEVVGIVGESGSGKSVTSLSVMRLIPKPPGEYAGGQILFGEKDLLRLSEDEMRKIRGKDISMIFQEPMTSLNPLFRVGDQIVEAICQHDNISKKEAMEKAVEMLRLVEIPSPERRVHEYPHQMSGGMKQRVMISMAISCNPQLLIADEPTTALDVTIQAQILKIMSDLRSSLDTSILLITHDLGVVAEMAQRVIVMYAGKIMEEAPVDDLFESPLHPYTEGLIASIPSMDSVKGKLHVIDGQLPGPRDVIPGCLFAPRCKYVMKQCRETAPPLLSMNDRRRVACWLREKEMSGGGCV